MAQRLQNFYYEDVDDYEMDGDEEEEESDYQAAMHEPPGDWASESDEEGDVLDRATDTNAAQARQGKDIQGIPWEHLHFTRDKYRETRLIQYKNYENLNVPHDQLEQDCTPCESGANFYDFGYNTRSVKSTIVHFQLRNLVWATSKHDVYVMHDYAINHWSPIQRTVTEVVNLGGPLMPFHEERAMNGHQLPVDRIQISTMCARGNLLVAGGFHGEMVCKRLDSPGIAYGCKITLDDDAITNAIELCESSSGALRVVTSNNDSIVRVFDGESFANIAKHSFPWAVNHTSVSPDGKLILAVGDHPEGLLADAQSGKVVAALRGHLDFSFASAWHPDNRIFATGNQDTTCRIWDLRYLKTSITALKGRIGAIRSIRFSSDGRFMAMAEPADFVHVFDTKREYSKSQEIDLFGEVSGISFSPDTEAFFIGVADRTYGSLLEFNRFRYNKYLDSFV